MNLSPGTNSTDSFESERGSMVETETVAAIVKLSDLQAGQEAECFAILLKKERGISKKNEAYVKCFFRDKKVVREAPLWFNDPLRELSESWAEFIAYRLRVRAEESPRYGLQLKILAIRPAVEADGPDGYDFQDLVDSSRFSIDELMDKLRRLIQDKIQDPHVKRLVIDILSENGDLFRIMPAAINLHHGYTAGLLEHVWSMTRIAAFLADHYDAYYQRYGINPPLNKDVVVASAILHDIGKLRELKYHPVEARYTKEGSLIGHILMGRDMIREAARKIDGFPDETLLLLEHSILSHHGKREYGAPVVPLTIEALILSFIDDLDAKMNVAVRERDRSGPDSEFTDKIWALDNRRMYKGIPIELGAVES